jgi:hypothetical protein
LTQNVLSFVAASIGAFHQLTSELIQSLGGLSKAKLVLDFLNIVDADGGASIRGEGRREIEWDELRR